METPQTNGDVLPDRDRLDLRVDGKYYRGKNESESEISTRVPGVSCRSSVCAPSSCNVRLCLPGIMDSEGRVDGSRLRTYIFKNVSLGRRNMDFLGRLFLYSACLQAFCSPVFSAEWEAEVLANINALTGSCVVVPCRFRYPGGQKPSSRLSGLWHLHQKEENLNTKRYILAAEVSKVIDSFKDRTRLLGKLGDDNCTLEIDGVKDHDNGPFCFRIEIPDQDNFSFREGCVSIRSFDTPEKPKLTYKEKSYEGRPYTITCSVTHTCPSHMPVLTWSWPFDNENIIHYNNHKPGIWEVQSILSFIPNARDDDSDITCTAKFHGGKSSESKMSLRVKHSTVDMLHIIIPVSVVAVTAVLFGGLCFLMRKKYMRRIESLQNRGGFGMSMWNRISRLSRRRHPGQSPDAQRHDRRSFWSRFSRRANMTSMDINEAHSGALFQRTNNDSAGWGASKPRLPSPKSNHKPAYESKNKDFDECMTHTSYS
ncbi:myeloid cell surface antigen CD33-like isoform X2 [Paramormyrops kingsleyae]|uniref:myeloid cell surface antigen CD33-like isoform X2 n=1 Tax=Paramormyrops kingsleyae TaxID=1676925 RepID=UPI003B97701F